MTDPDEALSRLLSGDLEPEDEARLFADLASDPGLRRRLDAVRGLPGALAALPTAPLPGALRQRLIAIPGIQRRRRWVGPALGGLVAAAAALLLVRLGIREVSAGVLSVPGRDVLDRHGVRYSAGETVKRIDCQTESILAGLDDPQEAYRIVAARAGRGSVNGDRSTLKVQRRR